MHSATPLQFSPGQPLEAAAPIQNRQGLKDLDQAIGINSEMLKQNQANRSAEANQLQQS